jgi:hypothetical protein
MGKKNQTERYMEVNVPQDLMSEVAEVIENSEMDASILGIGDEAESINIGISYVPEQRGSLMEILELIEDYEPGDSE